MITTSNDFYSSIPKKRIGDVNKTFARQKNIKFSDIKWDTTPFTFKSPFAVQSIQTALIGSTEVFKQVIRYRNGTSSTIFFLGKDTCEYFDSEEKLLTYVRMYSLGGK